MENLVSVIHDFGGVILGGIISFGAAYLAQRQNFNYEREQTEWQQKIDFFNELMSVLPAETFLSKLNELKDGDKIPDFFTEKITALSCLAIRSELFASDDVVKKLNGLLKILEKGSIMSIAADGEKFAQIIIAGDFFKSYNAKVSEITLAIKSEIQESSFLHRHLKKQPKDLKPEATKSK